MRQRGLNRERMNTVNVLVSACSDLYSFDSVEEKKMIGLYLKSPPFFADFCLILEMDQIQAIVQMLNI